MLNLLFSQPMLFIVVLLSIIVALSFHEFAHAYAGFLQGDHTAQRLGRMTLNPLSHIDWVGLLLLVSVGFGWGKPVPFNPHNLKYKKWGGTFVAIAGPASNLLLALVCGALFRGLAMYNVLPPDNALMFFLGFSVVINLILMVFNLIPIPPLDGSKFLFMLLDKPQHAELRHKLEIQGVWILLAVLIMDSILNLGIFAGLFGWVQRVAVQILGSGVSF